MDVMLFLWKDKRTISLASSISNYEFCLRDGLKKPKQVMLYSNHMKGVDKLDQKSSYRISRGSLPQPFGQKGGQTSKRNMVL